MADSKKYDGGQWEHSLRKLGTENETIQSGDTIYANGQPITTYTLKGNEEHTGTPTPSNPVEVNGVGVRTENLFNSSFTVGYYLNVTTGLPDITADPRMATLTPIDVTDCDTVTFSFINERPYDLYVMYSIFNGNTLISRVANQSVPLTIDASDATKLYLCVYPSDISKPISSGSISSTMLNTGSTAKPFEPYGYKIPISSGGVTTNIYLGSTQTVRQIYKLVLDGTENYGAFGDNTWLILGASAEDFRETADGAICSHVPLVLRSNFTTNTCAWGSGQIGDFLINIDNKNAEDLKSYIAQQYANGTPVTVWYVLATADTGIVNEPLMKIGTYADTLSNAAQLPTTDGANTISVDTTVQPSEFTATWTGWHDASVQEYTGGVGNNKFDEQYPDISDTIIYKPIYVGDGNFTLSTTAPQSSDPAALLFLLSGNVSSGASSNGNGVWSGHNRTKAAVDGYVTIAYRAIRDYTPIGSQTMLNAGTTAMTYEPYEYGWV